MYVCAYAQTGVYKNNHSALIFKSQDWELLRYTINSRNGKKKKVYVHTVKWTKNKNIVSHNLDESYKYSDYERASRITYYITPVC